MCQKCGGGVCGGHVRAVYEFHAKDLIRAGLFGSARVSHEQRQVCLACHKTLRRQNMRALLAIPALALGCLAVVILVATIAHYLAAP
ncbi:MAG TPA: hypothetical protein VMM56_14135 [Planctomycetaceae bacterium]|nr:hypothetical protein [Planctomycetaceae bacterium]